MSHEKIFILTDLCMWEANKQNGTNYPHAIQVVDAETGQVRYIKSGSRIAFIEGEITTSHSQKEYNKATAKLSSSTQEQLPRKNGKRCCSKENKQIPKNKGL